MRREVVLFALAVGSLAPADCLERDYEDDTADPATGEEAREKDDKPKGE